MLIKTINTISFYLEEYKAILANGDFIKCCKAVLAKLEQGVEVQYKKQACICKTCTNCYAYVFPDEPTHKGTHTIYLCAKFWRAKDGLSDSKYGTLFHELTHFKDFYGTTDIKEGAYDFWGAAGEKMVSFSCAMILKKIANSH